MVNIIVELSKYLMIILMTSYTFLCFSIFGYQDPDKKKSLLRQQNVLMFMIHIIAYLVMYLEQEDVKLLAFYLMQVVLFGTTILLYTIIYPRVSRLVVNNMCMLLCIGMIMLTRLSYSNAVKQFVIAAGGVAISLVVPVVIRKVKKLSEWRKVYAIIGIVSLALVIVFFVASSFKQSMAFKDIVVTTALAAFHVLILVASKDLGAALIIFVVYLVMLYVATRQPLYVLAGLGAGSVASVGAYYLFNHVRNRVVAWKDPIASYSGSGYQVAQSLFAIGTGSWFGMGLFQGQPDTIPVASSDFIFSAICEEMGLIFGLCMTLVCVSCYVMFLNIAMQLRNMFYKLVALGLGTCYIFQVFLNIGGVTKFIPSTGVTLPLVSYGGSSILSTLIMFAIIQGLYILREDEEENLERKKKERLRAERGRGEVKKRARKTADVPQRAKRSRPAGQAPRKEKARPQQRVR